MRKIIYDDEALEDLVEQHVYITQQAGVDIADTYINGLLEATKRAAQWPYSGIGEPVIAKRLGKDPQKVRSVLYRNHRCYYYLRTEHELYVLGYIHTKRRRNKALRERLARLRQQEKWS